MIDVGMVDERYGAGAYWVQLGGGSAGATGAPCRLFHLERVEHHQAQGRLR